MDNQELLQKADMVLAALGNNGGLLNPEQSDTFYRTLIDQPTILGVARTINMRNPETEINKIGFGQRIMRPAVENTALSAGDRAKPDLGQVKLNTKEIIAEVRLPYAVLEDNIERGNMEQTILALIAERASLDLEELVIQGDTGSPDPYLAQFDGLLKQITSHTYDAVNTYIEPVTFSNALKVMPPKYKRNKRLLRWFVTHDVEQDWRNTLSNRQTSQGDAAIRGDIPATIHGVTMEPVALMTEGNGVLIDPQNLLIGIHRQFRLESERLISERQIKIVLTMRVGCVLEEEPAAVLVENLLNPED